MVSKLTVMHNTGISQQITAGNREASEKQENTRKYYLIKGLKPSQADRKADDLLRRDIGKPAAMLAYKDIYLVLAAVSLLPAIFIILIRAGRRPVDRVEVEPLPL
jgi:DHA2 family multidrug resistance protein